MGDAGGRSKPKAYSLVNLINVLVTVDLASG